MVDVIELDVVGKDVISSREIPLTEPVVPVRSLDPRVFVLYLKISERDPNSLFEIKGSSYKGHQEDSSLLPVPKTVFGTSLYFKNRNYVYKDMTKPLYRSHVTIPFF